MTIRDPKRRWMLGLTRGASLLAATMLALSVWATVDGDVSRADAAPTDSGQALVVHPTSGAPLDSGAKDTTFGIELPGGAACPGDSANDGWRVTSYIVAATTDPATLTFNADGPTGQQFGDPQSSFRQPMYDSTGSPFVVGQTANATPPPGPGTILLPPTGTDGFSFAVFGELASGFEIPAGEYNMGIACVDPAGETFPIDRYWNALLTISYVEGAMTWTVEQAVGTSVALAVAPEAQADVGATVTLTATITPSAAVGAVTFKDGPTTLDTVDVVSGTATLSTPSLAAGAHSLTAEFTSADASAFASSTSVAVPYTVGDEPAVTTTALSASPASPAAAGSSVTFTASVTPASAAGTVTFKDGGTTLGTAQAVAGGTATLTTASLTAGDHSITASFTPTEAASFAESTSTALPYTVTGAPVATTVTVTASPSTEAEEGEEVTFTASVSPSTAAGKITFKDGTDTIGSQQTVASGKATVKTSDLGVGDHSIKATFTPTDSAAHQASTSTALEYEVTEADAEDEEETGGEDDEPAVTTLTLTVTPAEPRVGDRVTLTATVSPTAEGTVTFSDGTEVLGTDPLEPATAAAASDELTAQATTDSTTPTTESMTSTTVAGDQVVAQAVTDSATATYVIESLAAGDHSFTAAFTPADTEAFAAASTASALTLTAAPTTSDTTVAPTATASAALSSSVVPGTLPFTGGGLVIGFWGLVLLVLGRMAILMSRHPGLRDGSQ